MVLVTGPTGSGKTVSLYTALNILNTEERNISTVEDPVEIRVPGINQVQQNLKRGMTFAAALRSFLRQDPDVIMVGEIRDLETAEIAIKAAQTGHMVLSTLHTNDAPQTISRLMNMGIAPVQHHLLGHPGDRAAPRAPPARLQEADCKLPRRRLLAEGYTEAEIEAGIKIYEAVGCSRLQRRLQGPHGHLPGHADDRRNPEDHPRGRQCDADRRRPRCARASATCALSALLKAKNGVTSLAEINRVTKD